MVLDVLVCANVCGQRGVGESVPVLQGTSVSELNCSFMFQLLTSYSSFCSRGSGGIGISGRWSGISLATHPVGRAWDQTLG